MNIVKSVAVGLMLAAAPLTALAQNAPPPPAAAEGPNPQVRGIMQQTRAQMEQIRTQTRSQMIAALSPAHRSTVATVVGQLALSAQPDVRSAAASLDSVLSPSEKQAIISIDTQSHAAMRTLEQRSRAAVAGTLTPAQQSQMQAREQRMQAFRASHPRAARTPDAGMIALRTLGGFGGWGHGHGHGPGPEGGPGPGPAR